MAKQNTNQKQTNPFSEMEKEVLKFWDKSKIFEKSVEKDAPKGDYVFYDGPPFGTGEPHYGHILSSVSKDVVPRYWTMRGFRVERRWGWDCHGLPIENIIEQGMDISGKKEIEKIGIDKFNESCRLRVLDYAEKWDSMVRRIGRWVDFKSSYKTMDLSYMESVWWAFKELWKKKLIYEGRKVLLYCPRCETPISNFEVAMDNSYKDITETSVYVKFKVKNAKEILGVDGDVYILAWTTTPWTLPGNVALAVGEKIDYILAKNTENKFKNIGEEETPPALKDAKVKYYIIAKEKNDLLLGEYNSEIIKEFKGKNLVDIEYEPLFDVPALRESGKKVYYVAVADFVTTEDGTGIVHTAVVYGEDDYNLGLKLDLPVIPALDEKGHFNETVSQFKGMYFIKANKKIIEDLDKRNLLFAKADYSHPYPFCHRCETQLFYNAIPAWFLNISKVRKKMLEMNKNINWFPEHLKEGRFAKGIEQAPDWNISRNRYFATPIPVWKCEICDELEIIASVQELKNRSGKKDVIDIHSHCIDKITWKCKKCDGKMKRISEVFDCWVESGSMPFAQMHYPFENKEKFEKNFPAQFISEYISQTRAWFYVMHVLSTALFDSHSFENVVTTGVIMNEKGEKMSKSKKNFPDPWKVIDGYGADALRYYLMSSSVMHAENINFSEKGVQESLRNVVMTLWNVYKFYEMYSEEAVKDKETKSKNVLDEWILMRLNQTIKEVTESMDNYNLPKATRPIGEFVNDLSTWYIRRSRDRYKGDDEVDKKAALETTGYVLLQLSKVIAPFMPFKAESIWQKVTGNDFKDENKSVHLEVWPKAGKVDKKILDEMEQVKRIVELGLAKRDEAGIKIRQPLSELSFNGCKLDSEFLDLVKDELNIKEVKCINPKGELSVELVTKLTPELKLEGSKREIVRFINALRKQAGMTIQDRAVIYYETDSKEVKEVFKKFGDEILKDTLSDKIINNMDGVEEKKEVKVNVEEVSLGIKKV